MPAALQRDAGTGASLQSELPAGGKCMCGAWHGKLLQEWFDLLRVRCCRIIRGRCSSCQRCRAFCRLSCMYRMVCCRIFHFDLVKWPCNSIDCSTILHLHLLTRSWCALLLELCRDPAHTPAHYHALAAAVCCSRLVHIRVVLEAGFQRRNAIVAQQLIWHLQVKRLFSCS